MGKQAIAIISTDKHLTENNALELLDLADQEINLALKLGVETVIWLGDIFDSRISQRQELLTCLGEMLYMYSEAGLQLVCIPGNHDKTDYESDESFLTTYQHHPNFELISHPTKLVMFGIEMDFVPFYSQDMWLKKFRELEPPISKKSILFSHTAVQGSVNNDGRQVSSKIQLKLFAKYGKVFLGHYHNAQQPGATVFHLPSTRQNNFGEDDEKGFTVLYNDLSTTLVEGQFKPYRTITLEASTVTPKQLKALSETDTEGCNVRVVITGTREDVKSINKKVLEQKGIVIKTKYDDIEVNETEAAEILQELSGSDLKEKFKTFCKDKEYEYAEGYQLLKEVMKWQE